MTASVQSSNSAPASAPRDFAADARRGPRDILVETRSNGDASATASIATISDQDWHISRTHGVYHIPAREPGEPYALVTITSRGDALDLGEPVPAASTHRSTGRSPSGNGTACTDHDIQPVSIPTPPSRREHHLRAPRQGLRSGVVAGRCGGLGLSGQVERTGQLWAIKIANTHGMPLHRGQVG